MTKKIYRGTKLSEAVRILQNQYPHQASYRITDKDEAFGYAKIAQWKDRSNKGAIIESKINLPSNIISLNPKEIDLLYEPQKQPKDKVIRYSTDKFDILIIPYSLTGLIKDSKIITIVQEKK